jgi:hypothetical protein
MMTKEVAQVIACCAENKVSYKQCLEELEVQPWTLCSANADTHLYNKEFAHEPRS